VTSRIRIGVVGFRGYVGEELLRLLRGHSDLEPVLLEHRDPAERPRAAGRGAFSDKALATARRALSVPFSPFSGLEPVPFSTDAVRQAGLAVVLLATPPEASVELVPQVLEAGARVIDLSGAFRLASAADYQRWYGVEHARPELLEEAVYGLPELARAALPRARVVANPGCYATVVSLALRPLVAAGLVDRGAGVACDAKSGITGAGQRATSKTHFCSVAENLTPYGFFEHRHIAEILANTGLAEPEISFMTQLLPVQRGLQVGIHLRTTEPLPWEALHEVYAAAYGGEPFVRLYPQGTFPGLHGVTRTNYCDIAVEAHAPTRRVIIVAVIDNLTKGAAGQAVQNLNAMLGLPETLALL
jgi:N-acetyl-gamma-glutamyl-phosphate reductase